MNNEKWYVVENIADEVEVAIVKLTDDEVKAVNKFFSTQKIVVDEVFVGRIRRDESVDSGVNLWVVADNIRKGAATNAIQILEKLLNA